MPDHPSGLSRSAWSEKDTEVARMAEQEREGPLPDADRGDAAVGHVGNDPRPAHDDPETPADQAVINEERALASGEENVV
jgi:hypothetical protein